MSINLYRRGKIWHYRGTVAGRRLRGSTETTQKDIAERVANEAERREFKGRLDGPGSILTFAQAAIEYRKGDKFDRYLESVEDYWKDMLVKDITRGAVRRGAVAQYPQGKGSTRNRCFIVPTMAVINYAAELELCPPIRVDYFPVVHTERTPVTKEWVSAFMANASPHLGALACFMFGTGARISEALDVRWRDVDLGAGRVIIRQGKLGGEERRPHLPPAVVAAIANIPSNREDDAKVFQYSTYHTAKFPWRAAVKRAGIKDLSFHCCRHGFATSMLQAGVDVVTVAKLGGWKSPAQIFKTYGHANRDDTLTNRLFDTQKTQALNSLVDETLKKA